MKKIHRKNKRKHGIKMTVILCVILILVVLMIWSLFISGPNRVKEMVVQNRIAKIEKAHKNIKGISEHDFDYVTYQGYDDTTLYWFNAKSKVITTRDIDTLDYAKAKKIAKKKYNIKCDTITLGYGYNNPVYEIRGSHKVLLLDYDSFIRVYERQAK